MSLRTKIVLLFLGLAVAPLMLVAGFGYWQASRLARDVVGGPVEASVFRVTEELARSLDEAYAEINRLAQSPVTRAMLAGDLEPEAWRAALSDSAGNIDVAYLELAVDYGGLVYRLGRPPEREVRCVSGKESRWVTLEKEVGRGVDRVLAERGGWFDELLPRSTVEATQSLFVLSREDGRPVFSSSCGTLEEGLDPDLLSALSADGPDPGGRGARRVEYTDRTGRRRIASVWDDGPLPWQIVATASTDAILGPLNRLQASYWFFVLMMAAGTALAFSLLLGRVIRSLEELTAATESIGEGELNPWLPPPGKDEVGRLSLAFSGMLERIRQMMQRVDQSGRLAVVGQLASYLAHEIRNPLSSIRMNLQSLQREVARGRVPEDCAEAIDISLREVDRLSGSLTSVLQLGRPVSGEPEPVGIHDLVEDAVELLARELRRAGITVTLELDAAADRVMSIPGQLKGVFLNLIMNAVEAQSDSGGQLEIRSRLVSTPGGGPLVSVRIRDHGRGISPELRDRIFEPFFTTKRKGSGIGLAVALRTVREHGGDLYFAELPETAPGSEFVVDLPLAAVVTSDAPGPAVHLPSWMDSADPTPSRTWSHAHRREEELPASSKLDDVGFRHVVAFSNPDPGEVH